MDWYWQVLHLQARAAVVVAPVKAPVGRAPWVREAPVCAAAPAWEGLPDQAGRKMYVPTAAAESIRDQASGEVRALVPAEVEQWVSAGAWRFVLAVEQDLAGWGCREWAEAERPVLVPAEGRECHTVEAGHPVSDRAAVSAVAAGRDSGKARAEAGEHSSVEVRDIAPAPDVDSAAAADSH